MYQYKRAFTLIELLVVVLIIGILAAVALPQYNKAVETSRLTEGLQAVRTLKTGIEFYVLRSGMPSTETRFLGTSATDTLDIELGLADCDQIACYSPYFKYQAYCTSFQCCVYAYRSQNKQNVHYDLSTCYNSTDSWYEPYCTYQDDLGEALCKTIENQGWEPNE